MAGEGGNTEGGSSIDAGAPAGANPEYTNQFRPGPDQAYFDSLMTKSTVEPLLQDQDPQTLLRDKDLPRFTNLNAFNPADLPGNPGFGGNPDVNPSKLPDDQQEAAAQKEAEQNAERKSTKVLERETLGILVDLEHQRWSATQEEKLHFEFLGDIQALSNRERHLSVSRNVLIDEGAQAVPGREGWYYGQNLDSSYGLSTSAIVIKNVFGEDTPVQIVNLGKGEIDPQTQLDVVDSDRKGESKKIGEFLRDVEARQIIGHIYKFDEDHRVSMLHVIENTQITLSAEFKGEHLKALFTLPALPEDRVNPKDLVSLGGVKFNKEYATSEMMFAAMVAMEARALCEKPDIFDKFVVKDSFKKLVVDDSVNPDAFRTYFGDSKKWEPRIIPSQWSAVGKDVNKLKDQKYFEGILKKDFEVDHTRGVLAKDNIFARKVSVGDVESYKKDLVNFLGGSATARNAVDLAFEFYGITLCGDFSGFEWREEKEKDPETEKDVPALFTEPQMGHLTTDAQQVIRTAECLRFFRHNDRGGLPRGIKEGIKPFAPDILRGTTWKDDKGVTHSLYTDIFWDGVLPEKIPVDKLDDANPLAGSLLPFMAVCHDFGDGSFEIMKEKYPSPEPLKDFEFWKKPWSRLKVGVRDSVVSWSDFWEKGEVSSPTPEVVNEYRLEKIREMLDGIFGEPGTIGWDIAPKKLGVAKTAGIFANRETYKGALHQESSLKTETNRVREAANTAISGLNYSEERLIKIRKELQKFLDDQSRRSH